MADGDALAAAPDGALVPGNADSAEGDPVPEALALAVGGG